MKGCRRLCGAVPSVCLTLADLQELLSSVWLSLSSLACEFSVPVPSAWLDPAPHTQPPSGCWRPGAALPPLPNIPPHSFPMSGITLIPLWTAPTPTNSNSWWKVIYSHWEHQELKFLCIKAVLRSRDSLQ